MSDALYAVLLTVLALGAAVFGVFWLTHGLINLGVLTLLAAIVVAIFALRAAGIITKAVDVGGGQ